MIILAFMLSSTVWADSVRAPLKFISNTMADYSFTRPSPGKDGAEIFKTLCSSTPPGCEKEHPAPGIPIACAITPQYKEMEQGFHIQFKRAPRPEFKKDWIVVEEFFLSGSHPKANEVPIEKPGQIIAWKWNEDIKEELQDHLLETVKDKETVNQRMRGFEYRMINDLKHEKYHVDMHFIPYYKGLEKLFNSLEFSDWRRKEWIVPEGGEIPDEEIHKSLQEYIGAELKKLEKQRQEEVDKFHAQQDSYSNYARFCACFGDMEACKQMDTFWAY